jgi:pimeloyl-ACP methyl ester carboxylesterase
MAEPWRFEYFTLRSGLRMRVARAGSGPLVVMLHGFPECWYSWRHQLRALSDTFECVAPDLRGYGETDAPVGVMNYTGDKLQGDIVDLIEALGRKCAAIVAHDWGGGIAWGLAADRPEVVQRLAVLNCPHPRRFVQALRSSPRQMARSWYMLFFQLPYLPEALLRAGNFRVLDLALRGSSVQKDAFTDDDIAQYRAAFKNPYSTTAAINYYRAMFRTALGSSRAERERAFGKIAAPTLLIWGEQDIALGKELTYGMDDLFTGPFEIRYIPDSGHWVQQEKPDLVNQYLREFLSPLAVRAA